MKWTADELGELDGQNFVVTGANSGLGLQTTRSMARAGARVVMAVRSVERGREAAAGIDGDVEVRRLDLADLSSVAAFADGIDFPVDALVNNAGIMAVPEGRTADGFELQIGTNHLGHFALTNRLLERVRGRVVTVSSLMHRTGKIDLDDLNWERRGYDRWGAYSQSKLANLLFTAELQRRLDAAGSTVRATAAHPGYSATNLQSRTGNFIQDAGMKIANLLLAQSDSMGALPVLYAAVADVPGNGYAGPGGLGERSGHPQLVGRSARASDSDAARALWEVSERLTGLSFPL